MNQAPHSIFCPHCGLYRRLAEHPISQAIYARDHSELVGYLLFTLTATFSANLVALAWYMFT